MGMTEWLVTDRVRLFRGGDPTVASFALWHMVEETEHKSVAFDVYQAVCGKYWLRVYGLVHGSFHVAFMARRAYIAMLKRDGQWWKLRSRLRLWGMIGRFFFKAGGAMLRSLSPGYHPDKASDPQWVHDWQRAYSEAGQDCVPLLDTTSAQTAPCFS